MEKLLNKNELSLEKCAEQLSQIIKNYKELAIEKPNSEFYAVLEKFSAKQISEKVENKSGIFNEKDVKKIEKTLIKNFRYNKHNAEFLATQINKIDKEIYNDLLNYIKTGDMHNFVVKDYTLYNLILKHDFNIPTAYVMISGLKNNFNEYEKIINENIGEK